jgi:uncharacterized integral membrane protein (TIGR00697 family)
VKADTSANLQGFLVGLCCLFAGCLVVSAVMASKVIAVGGLVVPAGVLAYCACFWVTDVISEIWGKVRARTVVLAGFVALLAALLLIQISIRWPPASFWAHQEAYRTILGTTSRIMVASLTAYLVSQYHDVWAFHFWHRITAGRHLWLRNCASTIVSQALDTVVFITIAFAGSLPVLPLIFGQWVVKAAVALLDTPFVYLAVGLLRHRSTRSPA